MKNVICDNPYQRKFAILPARSRGLVESGKRLECQVIAVCKSVSRALCGQPSPRTQLQLRLFLYRAEIKPHASVKLYTIAFIYIVNSVFQ